MSEKFNCSKLKKKLAFHNDSKRKEFLELLVRNIFIFYYIVKGGEIDGITGITSLSHGS